MTGSGLIIGVDIGGTFTDAVVIEDGGTLAIGKAPSTPPDFETGFIDSLRSITRRSGGELEELLRGAQAVYHGCTVGTNALVERRTAKVGLLTTRGHRDSVFIMGAGGRNAGLPPEALARAAKHYKPDPPLVPKGLVEEIDERITFDGVVQVELNRAGCREAIERLVDRGVESFAVSLLWSVVNPTHEQAVAELIREIRPDAFVSLSSHVVPRTGEYQRTVATVINSLIGPGMDAYLRNLEGQLRELGYDKTLWVMSCSGGVIDSAYARSLPLLTIGSGPVAGLIGAGRLARAGANADGRAGVNVITGDMGGTTFDVGVIRRGEPLSRAATRYDQYEYFVPTLDVRSVGAGGGSLVRFDEGTGSLRVGPESAGARPGPVAYRRGGTEPTVTDADLVLGYLNPDYFLGGEITLDVDAAAEALARAGEPLGYDAPTVAAAAARIVDNQMADAIRLASVQQGFDVRTHVMYAYGGAGPLHATAIARQLGMREIIVPLGDLASGWSAFGAASADAVVVEELSKVLAHPFDPEELNAAWDQLERRVFSTMQAQGIARHAITVERVVDMRYSIQINTVGIMAPPGAYDRAAVDGLVTSFEAEYARLFGQGTGYSEAGFVMTGMRVRAHASLSDPVLASAEGVTNGRSAAGEPLSPKGERDVIFYEHGITPRRTPIYDGGTLRAESAISGPAIVEFLDTTLLLRDGNHARVDALGSLTITV